MNIKKIKKKLFFHETLGETKYAKRKKWDNKSIIILKIGWACQEYPEYEKEKEKPKINDYYFCLVRNNLMVGIYKPSIADIIAFDWEIFD